ncbi:hypothetical protein [Comamonas sp. 17RB]|uniref:hypothetical protein n=1 Tax=Comamonas sp. 17RB TaxID=3047025 RepID=UPI0024B65F1D|nr:hypothetical protein [Comamonas sp. 17RB]MDI9855178.1 hypothetical protein [Comamonas sp. 17RB]
MTESKVHEFKFGEGRYSFFTGKDESGWRWGSDDFQNSEVTFHTREAAIKDAEAEISLRAIRNVRDQVHGEFDALSKRITQLADPTLGEDELEPLYEEVLGFLEAHPAHRVELAQRLINVMGAYRFGRERSEALLPSTAIAYSMHVLRWPEVREFAEQEHRDFYAPKMETLMTSIMDAFEDDWEDRDFYKRFQSEI